MDRSPQSSREPARSSELRAMAAWLAARGLPVFPCRADAKTPATANGFKDASTDPAAVADWWARSAFNVGLATGPAGLVVLDLDTPKPGAVLPPEWAAVAGVHDGADVLAVLADRAGAPFPADTRTVATPSGGLHLWFAHPGAPCPPIRSGTAVVGPLVDVRAHGGYVLTPPSTTPAGTYRTINGAPPAPLPAWLVHALAPPATRPQAERPTRPDRTLPYGGDRYAVAAFAAELDRVLTATPGTRNDTLNRAAHALGTLTGAGRLDPGQVYDALTIAAEHIGLTPTETDRTITSGLAAGTANPRHPAHTDTGRSA